MSKYKAGKRDWMPATVQQQSIKAQKIGTATGNMLTKLSNNPVDAEHNHNSSNKWTYSGFSPKASMYHIWRCEGATPDKPRREVDMVLFDPLRFDPDSQAGRGQCSMRQCVGNAVMMSATRHLAYCGKCVLRYTINDRPCPATMLQMCLEVQALNVGLPEHMKRTCTVCERERIAA